MDIRFYRFDVLIVGGSEAILLVEEKGAPVEITGETLGDAVVSHTNGEDAYQAFFDDPPGFDRIITGQMMADITGAGL